MYVQIGDKLYDSKKELIILQLDDELKKLISNMGDQKYLAIFPDDMKELVEPKLSNFSIGCESNFSKFNCSKCGKELVKCDKGKCKGWWCHDCKIHYIPEN